MPSFKNGIGCAFTEEFYENSCCLHHCNISFFKAQGGLRDNPENHYWEEALQNETVSYSGKQFISFSKMLFNCWSRSFTVIKHCVPTRSRCGTAILGVWLSTNRTLIGCSSKGANFGWNNWCFHNSRKCEFYPWFLSEYFLWPFDLPGFHPSHGLFPCQILPEETPMQE